MAYNLTSEKTVERRRSFFNNMDTRPTLDQKISVIDFKDFYWLKSELLTFCRAQGLKTNGGKIEITKRIIQYLETGIVLIGEEKNASKIQSKFDWNTATLTPQTCITDNYKSTENVRNYFVQQLGNKFKFNLVFMQWMKNNVGQTLQAATTAWQTIEEDKKKNKGPKNVAPQFEYNRYLRDFLKDNPDSKRADGIALWHKRRNQRGDNVYHPSDLMLLKKEGQ